MNRILAAVASGFTVGLLLAIIAGRANARPYTPPGTTYPAESAIQPVPGPLPLAGAAAAHAAKSAFRDAQKVAFLQLVSTGTLPLPQQEITND